MINITQHGKLFCKTRMKQREAERTKKCDRSAADESTAHQAELRNHQTLTISVEDSGAASDEVRPTLHLSGFLSQVVLHVCRFVYSFDLVLEHG